MRVAVLLGICQGSAMGGGAAFQLLNAGPSSMGGAPQSSQGARLYHSNNHGWHTPGMRLRPSSLYVMSPGCSPHPLLECRALKLHPGGVDRFILDGYVWLPHSEKNAVVGEQYNHRFHLLVPEIQYAPHVTLAIVCCIM